MVAILFAARNSPYKSMPECDVWGDERDARNFRGREPVVAHPPCRLFCRLRHFSTAPASERELGLFAARVVRTNGGVLEHPYLSALWDYAGLPRPGTIDSYGGFTLPVLQFWWGYDCYKPTWLYIVGVSLGNLPTIPYRMGRAPLTVSCSRAKRAGAEIAHSQRSSTVPSFARWLVHVAELCR